MIDLFEEYVKLLKKLLALNDNGLGETELAKQIKDRMNFLWYKLTPLQRDQIHNLGLSL